MNQAGVFNHLNRKQLRIGRFRRSQIGKECIGSLFRSHAGADNQSAQIQCLRSGQFIAVFTVNHIGLCICEYEGSEGICIKLYACGDCLAVYFGCDNASFQKRSVRAEQIISVSLYGFREHEVHCVAGFFFACVYRESNVFRADYILRKDRLNSCAVFCDRGIHCDFFGEGGSVCRPDRHRSGMITGHKCAYRFNRHIGDLKIGHRFTGLYSDCLRSFKRRLRGDGPCAVLTCFDKQRALFFDGNIRYSFKKCVGAVFACASGTDQCITQ